MNTHNLDSVTCIIKDYKKQYNKLELDIRKGKIESDSCDNIMEITNLFFESYVKTKNTILKALKEKLNVSDDIIIVIDDETDFITEEVSIDHPDYVKIELELMILENTIRDIKKSIKKLYLVEPKHNRLPKFIGRLACSMFILFLIAFLLYYVIL